MSKKASFAWVNTRRVKRSLECMAWKWEREARRETGFIWWEP